jgi:alpha-L-fucosidase 2
MKMPFDFMLRMGIWTENFALPAVIAECMMQSYPLSTSPHVCGPIRLFPNWPADKPAEFCTLRATGAFLVSARIEEGVVVWVEITSEKGKDLRLINPWPGPAQCINETGVTVLDARLIELPTKPGQTLRFQPA